MEYVDIDLRVIKYYEDEMNMDLSSLKVKDNGWTENVKCPLPDHNDKNPSFGLNYAESSYKCFSCGENGNMVTFAMKMHKMSYPAANAYVTKKTGIEMPNTYKKQLRDADGNKIDEFEEIEYVAEYQYRDEKDKLVYTVKRGAKQADGSKEFKVFSLTGEGLDSGTKVYPYRLPQIMKATKEDIIYIVEGEKDVDNLMALGYYATTIPKRGGGVKAALDLCWTRDKNFCIIPDNDKAGAKYAESVHLALLENNNLCNFLIKIKSKDGFYRDLKNKADISDWIKCYNFKLFDRDQLKKIKPEDRIRDHEWLMGRDRNLNKWFIKNYIPAKGGVALIGKGGCGKSFLALRLAISLASGYDKKPFQAKIPRKVMVFNGEDDEYEMADRIENILEEMDLSGSQFKSYKKNFWFQSLVGGAKNFMELKNNNPVPTEMGIKYINDVENFGIDLAIIDTKATMCGLDENSNDLTAAWASFVACTPFFNVKGKDFNALIVHHSGKAGTSERGASSFSASMRHVLNLDSATNESVGDCLLEDSTLDTFVALKITKSNKGISGGVPCICQKQKHGVVVPLKGWREQVLSEYELEAENKEGQKIDAKEELIKLFLFTALHGEEMAFTKKIFKQKDALKVSKVPEVFMAIGEPDKWPEIYESEGKKAILFDKWLNRKYFKQVGRWWELSEKGKLFVLENREAKTDTWYSMLESIAEGRPENERAEFNVHDNVYTDSAEDKEINEAMESTINDSSLR